MPLTRLSTARVVRRSIADAIHGEITSHGAAQSRPLHHAPPAVNAKRALAASVFGGEYE
jgi:hypothetical protein